VWFYIIFQIIWAVYTGWYGFCFFFLFIVVIIVFILLISLSIPGQRVTNVVTSTSYDFPVLFVTPSQRDGVTKSVAVFPLTLRTTCEHATQFWSQGLPCSHLVDCMSGPGKESLPVLGNGRREALSMRPTVKPSVVILVLRCAIQKKILYIYIFFIF